MDEPKDQKRPIYYDILMVMAFATLAFFIGFKMNKSDRVDTNAFEQRLRDINADSEHKIDSLLKSTLNSFNQAETVIDNTKTIVKREQQITNEYVQNSYILMSIPDSTQLKVYDANMELYRERFAKGYYHISGHNY
jgi:hypothetical protein